jgi:hypothetical protein
MELRKQNIASWPSRESALVRNLENKLPAGNIRKLLMELQKQNIAGWPSGESAGHVISLL